ncbi:MAG: diphthine synthase [Candidatus Anstonellaceae archaeon]
MATLYLIGLGIADYRGLSLEAIEILKKTKTVFIENYTNFIEEETIKKIEKMVDKKLIVLGREEVENEKIILEQLKKRDCSMIVAGDPLIATTHISLVLSCKKHNHEVKIIHNSSILSAAIAESGLQVYKFGKTCSIPYWRENYKPVSFLEVIETNNKIQAHTLCLLDIDKELGPMSVKRALNIIFEAQKEIKKQILDLESKVIILSNLGRKNQQIWAGKIKEFLDKKEDVDGPAVLIIPSTMHFVEEEYFRYLEKNNF